MERLRTDERHYRVVRYFTDFNGLIKEELASNLSFEEAEALATQERGRVPGEEIDVQDQNERGLDAEVDAETDLHRGH